MMLSLGSKCLTILVYFTFLDQIYTQTDLITLVVLSDEVTISTSNFTSRLCRQIQYLGMSFIFRQSAASEDKLII
jgi:hypothetical protein